MSEKKRKPGKWRRARSPGRSTFRYVRRCYAIRNGGETKQTPVLWGAQVELVEDTKVFSGRRKA